MNLSESFKKRMTELAGINEKFFGGNIHAGAHTNPAQEAFLAFARGYQFVHKGRKYNDFTFLPTEDGNLQWESGRNGSYRPEGYMWGDASTSKSIADRLQLLVNAYNAQGKNQVSVNGRVVVF